MVDRAIDDKSSNTLVVVSGEGFWTGSSTLPHLHHFFVLPAVSSLFRAPKPRLMITAAAFWLRAADTETPGHGPGRTWRRWCCREAPAGAGPEPT